jgi:para-nitrobenzyl esterase
LKLAQGSVLLAAALAWSASAAAESLQIDGGRVEGVNEAGVQVFKGLPFAAAPVGPLRWREPQVAPTWAGTLKADTFSAVCPQNGSYPPESAAEPTSEDCLYLNIWRPAEAISKPLPVMVWIYGGALENGSASTPLYAGDGFSKRGVILVTFNYRLGVLGFLSLKSLKKESANAVSGNYGLLDQIAALKWVQRNIGAFGGDAHNVTIFGQSSGSISVSALVASPLAKALFQRAIGESGGLFEPLELSSGFSLAGAEGDGEWFAHQQGDASLELLRAKSPAELLKTSFDAHFVIDGYVLKQSPFDAYRQGAQNDVDVLVGSNSDEGQLFLQEKAITVGNFKEILAKDFPAPLVWILNPEPGNSDAEARESAAAVESDMRFRWDMWAWARLAAQKGGKHVYLYQFSRAPPFSSTHRYFGLGATHGMEMPYVFSHLGFYEASWTATDRRLAEVMPQYWTNFAKSGDPNAAGLPMWPSFRESPDKVMMLGEELTAAAIPGEARLVKIDRIYATVRFGNRHQYWVLGLGILVALALVTLMIALFMKGYRSWRRRP